MNKYECSKCITGIYKKTALRADNFVVDRKLGMWNTFFDIALDWEPKLRNIYNYIDDSTINNYR